MPHKALFLEFELAADIQSFEDAAATQDKGMGNQVGGTASLDVLSAKGMKARKQLQAIVPNKFKGNAAALAEWATAQRIEKAPSTTPPPAPTPA